MCRGLFGFHKVSNTSTFLFHSQIDLYLDAAGTVILRCNDEDFSILPIVNTLQTLHTLQSSQNKQILTNFLFFFSGNAYDKFMEKKEGCTLLSNGMDCRMNWIFFDLC